MCWHLHIIAYMVSLCSPPAKKYRSYGAIMPCTMSATKHDAEDYTSMGEVPTTDPGWMVEPSQDHFEHRANTLNRNMPHGHEVATKIKDKVVPVFSEHKKEIIEVSAAALTVAGVLFAIKELHRRQK